MSKELALLILAMVLAIQAFAVNSTIKTAGNDSVIKGITQDETILYNMINDIRMQAKLTRIPMSASLCTVANTHIVDLIVSRPQDKGCSLHSWSSSGKWTPCCNSKDPAGIQCMKSKPREITGYPGNGFELIYWGDENATPADAAALWQQVDASSDMILCRNKWKDYQWKAMGVGMKDGYAVIWLGDKTDNEPKSNQSGVVATVTTPAEKAKTPANPAVAESTKKKTESIAVQKAAPGGDTKSNEAIDAYSIRYYLIVASVKSTEAAHSELKRIKSKGYPDAFILEGSAVYRIALSSFDSPKNAANKLNDLKNTFPGIWVLKK